MYPLRRWSALFLALLIVPVLHADDKPAKSAWLIDRTLTVTPQAAPVPALQYRLLPLSSTLKEGNAVPIYLRLVHEQRDESRKYWTEKPGAWNELPLNKLPLDEVRQFTKRMHNFYQQFEFGARRSKAEWNYTLDAGNPIGLLLPDAQNMRNYNPMLVLQVRLALADRNFPLAVHHLQTGLAFNRHVAEAPTLIHSLIALANSTHYMSCIADFIEQPNSPNLYWALTALPRPFIDLNKGYEFELRTVELQFPELSNLDQERPFQVWDTILRRIRTEVHSMATISKEGDQLQLLPFFDTNYSPDEPASKSRDLSAARLYVSKTKNLSADKVEAMPAAQVLLMYLLGQYNEFRDDSFRSVYLPYAQRETLFNAAEKRLLVQPTSEGHRLARVLLPAVMKVSAAQTRFERHVAALRIVEALRIYVAAHQGKLPASLNEIRDVPIPDDPTTSKPFEYTLDSDAAVIVSPNLPNVQGTGLRYRVVFAK